MNDQETDKKLRITLKPFNLPTDRHYVKVGDDVIKFQSEFCRTDGSHLPADLPTHVRDVVESDIRDAVIKLCIGELDNQKRLEKAQSVIKIDKQPWHTKKRYYTAVGNEFMDSPKKKKTLNPKYMYILSLRLKEETFSNSQGDKAQPSRSSSSKSRKRKHQGGINPSAEPLDKRNSCTIC